MSTFKVGDRVRVIKDRGTLQVVIGSLGTVVPRGHYAFDYELTVDVDGKGTYYFYADELELAVPTEEVDPGLKPTNPKDIVGSEKLPLHLWPETATLYGCLGLLDGALKYGRSNWRETGVRYSIYIDAVRRHLNALFEGEDVDPDSGVPHLSHALACLAIIADAQAAGKLNDDRQFPGGYRSLVEELTPHVARLKDKHAGRDPKHWTIADA